MYEENRFSYNWLVKKLINDKVRTRLPYLRGSVLDLGCGVRPFEKDILLYADFYIAVDWSNSLHGLQCDVVANLNKPLPYKTESVDHVVAFEVLEHLAEPDTMLEESCRVLRMGGSISLSVPFQWWLHEVPWDYQRFTKYGLEYRLAKAGFSDICVTETSGFWSMWVLKLNYQLARLVRGPFPVRWAIRILLVPFWWLDQTLARLLDNVWPGENETCGYFVTATKQ